jgi:putative ABC transport system permease protein
MTWFKMTWFGRPPEETNRQANLALGGREQVKENTRDACGTRWLEDLLADAAYAFRTLRTNFGFTLICLLTLGLGIGATTAIFTLVNSVLLNPAWLRSTGAFGQSSRKDQLEYSVG